jgi:hypothetical protein
MERLTWEQLLEFHSNNRLSLPISGGKRRIWSEKSHKIPFKEPKPKMRKRDINSMVTIGYNKLQTLLKNLDKYKLLETSRVFSINKRIHKSLNSTSIKTVSSNGEKKMARLRPKTRFHRSNLNFSKLGNRKLAREEAFHPGYWVVQAILI